MTGQLSSSSDITFKEGKIKAEKRARTPFFAYQKRKKKEKKKTTMSKYGTADKANYETSTFSWDGHQFTAMNPDFFKKERKKVRQMTYGEAADYHLCGSGWRIAFADLGWVRKEEADGVVTYSYEKSEARYFKSQQRRIESTDKAVITFNKGGRRAVYRRVISGTIYHDDGRIVELIPEEITEKGARAMSRLTEGIWNAITGKD